MKFDQEIVKKNKIEKEINCLKTNNIRKNR